MNHNLEPSPEKFRISEFIRQAPQLADLIKLSQPREILEIGSWHGRSVITLLHHAQELGLTETKCLCVDTWLGSIEHWLNRYRGEWSFDALGVVDGEPTFIETFRQNVAASGFSKQVEILRTTSNIALEFLRAKKRAFDIIYVDGGHSYSEVRDDLKGSWSVLNPQGVISGDDWDWLGVRMAVRSFALRHSLRLWCSGPTWALMAKGHPREEMLSATGWSRQKFWHLFTEMRWLRRKVPKG